MKKKCRIMLEGNTKNWAVPFWMEDKYHAEWVTGGLNFLTEKEARQHPNLLGIANRSKPVEFIGRHSTGLHILPVRKEYVWSSTCLPKLAWFGCKVGGEYGGNSLLTDAEAKTLQDDGVEVFPLINRIPEWVVNAGLLRPWVFLQDLFAFRNPFSGAPFRTKDLK